MRKYSGDIDRTIENNGAVTLPCRRELRGSEAQKHTRVMAWFVGAAIIGSALLRRRARS